MKLFSGKITLEQLINYVQVLHPSMAKTGEMEGIEGKVDCATRIARQN
jgi:hypothetical protein